MNKNNLKELLKKLYCKNQQFLLVLNAPREFLSVLWDMGKEINVKREANGNEEINFLLVFVRTKKEIQKHAKILEKRAADNAIIWFAFPKKNSKTYKSELSLQQGWDDLLALGYKSAGSVSVDNNWTALRFKK
jgi:hypothetical protein